MKYDNIDSGVAAYIDFLIEDYKRFTANFNNRDMFIDTFVNGVEIRKGKKYIKIIVENSVRAFIVAKDDGKFKAGDLLKAASWAAPAKNAARGNVLEGKFSGGWTGPQYL